MKTNPRTRRHGHQWMLDWLVKETGRVQNFEYDQRLYPPEVKSYRQIHRVMERYARHAEDMARAAEAAGHRISARDLFWIAAERYREAQHGIMKDDDPEKIYLHGKLLDCYEAMMKNCRGNRVERVEIPFEGRFIQAVFHMVPSGDPAPTVLFCPGMDLTKEAHMPPWDHPFVNRGLNCLHLDGPGQGTSNIRKIRVTLDNYEAAASAAIDYLAGRPEVDMSRIAVAGTSMGSYWASRIAATDDRVKAVASCCGCYGPKTALFEESSPRFKQMYMYMSGIEDEDAFDRMAEQMVLDDLAPRITCPSLQVVGEYDPLSDIDDAMDIFDLIGGPKEIWVVEDDYHIPRFTPNFAGGEFYGYLADWLNDALSGLKPPDLKRKVLIRRNGLGPYDPPWADGGTYKLQGALSGAQRGPEAAEGDR